MRQHPPLSCTHDTCAMDASVPALVIDQETLDHLLAFHRAIAEVLVERGRWQFADSANK